MYLMYRVAFASILKQGNSGLLRAAYILNCQQKLKLVLKWWQDKVLRPFQLSNIIKQDKKYWKETENKVV